MKDTLRRYERARKPEPKRKQREHRREFSDAERVKLNLIENRPQPDGSDGGRDERDGLVLLMQRALSRDFRTVNALISKRLAKFGGPVDASVMTRLLNGAKPVATKNVAPLALTLEVEPGDDRFAVLIELIACANLLRGLEKVLDRQVLEDVGVRRRTSWLRQAGVVLAALPVLRERTRELAGKLGVKAASARGR